MSIQTPKLLFGEGVYHKAIPSELHPMGSGHLWITNYRLIFISLLGLHPELRTRTILLHSIYHATRDKSSILVFGHPFQMLSFTFNDKQAPEEILQKIKSVTYPKLKSSNLTAFAFSHCAEFEKTNNIDWKNGLIDLIFKNSGIRSLGFKLFDIAALASRTLKYPRIFFVPNSMQNQYIVEALESRESQAFPLILYNKGDAMLLTARKFNVVPVSIPGLELSIISKNQTLKSSQKWVVLDVGKAPRIAVPDWQIVTYCDLPDCFMLFEQYNEVLSFVTNPKEPPLWPAVLKGWCQTMNGVGLAANTVVSTIQGGRTITVQGADKNCFHLVIAALSQLFLEPHYRTIMGFCVLLEQNWVSLYYPFSEGCALIKKGEDKKRFPYWEAFISIVHALFICYPTEFEFGEELLHWLLYESYGFRFTEFLFPLANREQGCEGAWDWIMSNTEKFRNPFYKSSETVLAWQAGPCPLFPLLCRGPTYDATWLRNLDAYKFSSHLSELNLSGLGLTCVLSWIFEISSLSSLNLASNYITSVPLLLFTKLTSLVSLDLSHNPIMGLTAGFFALIELYIPALKLVLDGVELPISAFLGPVVSLSCANCRSVSLEESPFSSKKLQDLNLSSNSLVMVPPAIWELPALTSLTFSQNLLGIFDVPTPRCQVLQTLILSNNKLVSFPLQVDKLSSLTHLDLSWNSIRSIPNFSHPGLAVLMLSHNKITSIFTSSEHSMFFPTELRTFDLSSNQITGVPSGISNLTSLATFNLSDNKITRLPSLVQRLTCLQWLDLSKNYIEQLPLGLGELTKLEHLDISENSLESIPLNLGLLRRLKIFKWDKNDLVFDSYPELKDISDQPFSRQLFSQKLAQGRACLRCPVMVVGSQNIGKTSLVRILKRRWKHAVDPEAEKDALQITGDTMSTDGIDIEDVTLYFDNTASNPERINQLPDRSIPVTVSFWDFAGQELYYTTHQFFVSGKSIYLVLFDLRVPWENSGVEYWISSIHSKEKKANIFVVGTFLDKFNDQQRDDLPSIYQPIKSKLSKKFPGMKFSFCFISTVDATDGIPDLQQRLERSIITHQCIKESVPLSYFSLEQAVLEMRQKCVPPIINTSTILHLGAMSFLPTEKDVYRACHFLHRCGVLLYFDNDPLLSQFIILEPSFITGLMSTLVTTKHNFANTGILRHSHLCQIWKPPVYPVNIHAHLLALLSRFEIAYQCPPTFNLTSVTGHKSSIQIQPPGNPKPLPPTPGSESPGDTPASAEDSPVDSLASSPTSREDLQPRKRRLSSRVNRVSERFSSLMLSSDGKSKKKEEGKKDSTSADNNSLFFDQAQFDSEGASIIPCLLNEHRPIEIRDLFPNVPEETEVEFERSLVFDFVPIGLFSRLLVRLLTLYPIEGQFPYFVWSEGFYFSTSQVKFTVRHFVISNKITIMVRAQEARIGQIYFCGIMAATQNLLDEWTHLTITASTRCDSCVRRLEAKPQMFSVSTLEALFFEGKNTVQCEKCSAQISFSELVPDLFMVYFQGKRVALTDLQFGRELGVGGFATVSEGSWENKVVAVKKLTTGPTSSDGTASATEFRREVFTMSQLNDVQTCVQLYAICVEPFCLVLEYIPHGDLYSFAHHQLEKEFNWELRIKVALDIAIALDFMHSRVPSILHLDLKSPNILMFSLDEQSPIMAKVSDFGLSSTGVTQYARLVDNPVWCAPEILKGQPYQKDVDVYSFGVILFELLTRSDFFGEMSFLAELSARVISGGRPTLPEECLPEYKSLLTNCWAQQSAQRPTFAVVATELKALHPKVQNQMATAKLVICFQKLQSLSSSSKDQLGHKARSEVKRFLAETNVKPTSFFKTPQLTLILQQLEAMFVQPSAVLSTQDIYDRLLIKPSDTSNFTILADGILAHLQSLQSLKSSRRDSLRFRPDDLSWMMDRIHPRTEKVRGHRSTSGGSSPTLSTKPSKSKEREKRDRELVSKESRSSLIDSRSKESTRKARDSVKPSRRESKGSKDSIRPKELPKSFKSQLDPTLETGPVKSLTHSDPSIERKVERKASRNRLPSDKVKTLPNLSKDPTPAPQTQPEPPQSARDRLPKSRSASVSRSPGSPRSHHKVEPPKIPDADTKSTPRSALSQKVRSERKEAPDRPTPVSRHSWKSLPSGKISFTKKEVLDFVNQAKAQLGQIVKLITECKNNPTNAVQLRNEVLTYSHQLKSTCHILSVIDSGNTKHNSEQTSFVEKIDDCISLTLEFFQASIDTDEVKLASVYSVLVLFLKKAVASLQTINFDTTAATVFKTHIPVLV